MAATAVIAAFEHEERTMQESNDRSGRRCGSHDVEKYRISSAVPVDSFLHDPHP